MAAMSVSYTHLDVYKRQILVQYGHFLAGLARGDLGASLIDDYPVIQEIGLRLPRTLELILAGTLIALVVGVPAGVYAAVHRGGTFDRVDSWITAILLAVQVLSLINI